MNNMEKDALEFIARMQRLYFENRNMEAVTQFMDSRIAWIGTGEQEICRGLEEAEKTLAWERVECATSFTVTEADYETLPISDTACIVYGILRAHSDDPMVADLHNRISAVCIKSDEEIKLLHLHISSPDSAQDSSEFYVKTNRPDNQILRSMMEKTARELKKRNLELEALTENIPGGVQHCLNDRYFTILDMSGSFIDMLGYTREEIAWRFHDHFLDMIHPEDQERVQTATREQLEKGPTVEYEYRVIRKDGTVVWLLDKGKLVPSELGPGTFYCIAMDITARKQDQEELRLSLERHKVIMDQTTDIIFEWDICRDTLLFSSNWYKKFGYHPVNTQISSRIPCSHNIHAEDMPSFVKIMTDTAVGIPYSATEFRIRDAGGKYHWCRIRATTQFDHDGYPLKAVGVIVDIDPEKSYEKKLLEQAETDALTSLLNKGTVQTRVQDYLQHSSPHAQHALMIMDLDNFKQINDCYGHLGGDAVLSDAAGLLKRMFRATDVVGRIGGDEFLVFMPNIREKGSVEEKAQEVLAAFRESKQWKYTDFPLSCSIGISLYPNDAADYTGLYALADQALYYVKNNGRQNYAFFNCAQRGCVPPDRAFSAAGTEIDWEKGSLNQTLARYTFRMLYNAPDIKTAVNQILEIVGRAYGVSRMYIFENEEDGAFCSNTFEWCNDGISREIDRLQHLSYQSDLGGYLQNFDQRGVFYCPDVRKLDAQLYGVLAQQGIASILQCAIMDGQDFKGFVGFDECRANRLWTEEQISSLTLVANVLSTFLLKLRLKERLSLAAGELSV